MDGLYGEDATIMGALGRGGGAANPAMKWRDNMARKFQYYLDKSTPHAVARWIGSLVVAAIYCLRAYYIQGFYIVTYGLGIYLLNLLIGFLSPQVDPESEGPALPTKGSDEFKPFIRRLPEFKFWCVFATTFLSCFPILCTIFFFVFTVTLLPRFIVCSSRENFSL
jgi:hypothetical protein